MADLFDLVETDRLLTTTRAVRKRLDLDRPVDPAVIRECLEIAIQAPTAANEQTWRWIVVTDPATRAALAEIYREAGSNHVRQVSASDTQRRARMSEGGEHLKAVLHRVPALVIPCVPRRGEMTHAEQAAMFASILPATWSFMLALRSRGLGSVWTTRHLYREREVAQLLGIPDNMLQAAMIPVAHTLGTDFKPAQRGTVDDVIYSNSWPSE